MELNLTEEFDSNKVIYTDFFRRYSNVMKQWLQTITLPSKTLNIHYGPGERIWSKIIRNRENYSIDLPIVSFFLTGYAPDSQHYIPPEVIINIVKNVMNAKPGFFKLTYEVTFWVKFLKEADAINYQIQSMFTPELYLTVRNNQMYRSTGRDYWIDCRILESKDAIELEPGDKADRVVKLEYSIEVDAKLPYIQQGYVARPIHLIDTKVYLDEELNKKNKKIKDNITDESYLETITEYMKKIKQP